MKSVVIIGGGAAGFFAAIRVKEKSPETKVILLEKTNKTLSKLRISGGGRCNVTHHCFDYSKLALNYPRGSKFLKNAFKEFGAAEFVNWIQAHKIELKTEKDGRMFPITDNSETIAGFFENYAHQLGVEIYKNCLVEKINYSHHLFEIEDAKHSIIQSQFLVLALGGVSDPIKLICLQNFPIKWVDSSPSLFTFNASKELKNKLAELSGVSVNQAKIKFVGQKEDFLGPILITHWGLSGPVVLKSSAWMSRFLKYHQYHYEILISWLGDIKEDEAKQLISTLLQSNLKKKIGNVIPDSIPSRLWEFLLNQSQIDSDSVVHSLNLKKFNRLIENLIRFPFTIQGKTTFKEEFVTAGGICLTQLNQKTCEFLEIPGLYACGEILDVDGITGGFNFQAAWTTAEMVSNGIQSKLINSNEPI